MNKYTDAIDAMAKEIYEELITDESLSDVEYRENYHVLKMIENISYNTARLHRLLEVKQFIKDCDKLSATQLIKEIYKAHGFTIDTAVYPFGPYEKTKMIDCFVNDNEIVIQYEKEGN